MSRIYQIIQKDELGKIFCLSSRHLKYEIKLSREINRYSGEVPDNNSIGELAEQRLGEKEKKEQIYIIFHSTVFFLYFIV